ncbi:hypothetical protein [Moorena sp. SIOASIH]|nr:hypothetical protein [Moorena sp. SIOASIH]
MNFCLFPFASCLARSAIAVEVKVKTYFYSLLPIPYSLFPVP